MQWSAALPTGLSDLNRGADRHPHASRADRIAGLEITDALLQQTRHLHVASYFLQTDLKPDLAMFSSARGSA
jgi:hypothetical protein